MGRRSLALAFVFTLAFFLLGLHLFKLQVRLGSDFKARAEAQSRSEDEAVERGQIYFTDKNNNQIIAALNREYPLIYVVPREIEDTERASVFISEMSGESKDKIVKLLSKKNSLYVPIVLKANANQLDMIKKSGIKGIYNKTQLNRFYPFGDLGAHVLGFVGLADDNKMVGRYGIERLYEKDLVRAEDHDVHLTIDRNIQAEAHDILIDLIKNHSAKGGTIIVQEPLTGKILTLENQISFDPNEYQKANVSDFLNTSLQAVYEPGSVLKIITMALALDAHKITKDTTYIDSGEVTLNGKTIKNWNHKAYGLTTMTQIIEKSINTGAVFVERQLGHNAYRAGLTKFGLGEKLGINLPGELSGSLKNLYKKSISDVDFATASFGQGISLTPLQLINAVSAIANSGVLMRPYITDDTKPKKIRNVISSVAAEQVKDMMVSAVDKAKIASINNYSIAGKTGTAQIPDLINGGYKEKFIHTYVGFAPANDPKFVVLIKLDDPVGAEVAASTVVPAFRQMAQFILNYYNIAPDRLP